VGDNELPGGGAILLGLFPDRDDVILGASLNLCNLFVATRLRGGDKLPDPCLGSGRPFGEVFFTSQFSLFQAFARLNFRVGYPFGCLGFYLPDFFDDCGIGGGFIRDSFIHDL
jgi:hypothetical protein